MWDVFISHATEDKDSIVRPLAEELKKYGVRVWYDEFELRLGDSLSASIDKGLVNSSFGILILSPAFFRKQWTDYELRSLLTKEIRDGKVILPVWHEVGKDFVASKSLFLADKKALNSTIGIRDLALEIVKVVRPDIINSHALKMASRNLKHTGEIKRVNIKDLDEIEGVRHKELPIHLVIATKVFSTLFSVGPYREMVINFAKDADYDTEFVLWTIITCAFIETMREYNVSFADNQKSDKFLKYLLFLSMHDQETCDSIDLDTATKAYLTQAYMKNAAILFPIIEK